MRRLRASNTNDELPEIQGTEGAASSTQYDVWRCEPCGHERILIHRKEQFSTLGTCPECGNRPLATQRGILEEPTLLHPRKVLEVESCGRCGYIVERWTTESTSLLHLLLGASNKEDVFHRSVSPPKLVDTTALDEDRLPREEPSRTN